MAIFADCNKLSPRMLVMFPQLLTSLSMAKENITSICGRLFNDF